MNEFSAIERAESYLTVHLAHAGHVGTPHSAGPFVTISRESGTGGSALGHALARRLSQAQGERESPWAVYSGNLIEEMLRANNLPRHLARFLPEDRIGEIDAAVGEIVGLHPNLWDLVTKTNDLIRHLARAGNGILLGRGANFATAHLSSGVHVRIVAPEGHRAANTARWLSIGREDAKKHNALRDAARRRYVRATFAADIAEPSAYDVVLNAERIPFDAMVTVIACLVELHREVLGKVEPTAALAHVS
jgi:cytidylate kinase